MASHDARADGLDERGLEGRYCAARIVWVSLEIDKSSDGGSSGGSTSGSSSSSWSSGGSSNGTSSTSTSSSSHSSSGMRCEYPRVFDASRQFCGCGSAGLGRRACGELAFFDAMCGPRERSFVDASPAQATRGHPRGRSAARRSASDAFPGDKSPWEGERVAIVVRIPYLMRRSERLASGR